MKYYHLSALLTSSKMNYLPPRLIGNLIHAPGASPRRYGNPVEIGLPGNPWIFRPFTVTPCPQTIVMVVGRRG
jgi:hypothetical protein